MPYLCKKCGQCTRFWRKDRVEQRVREYGIDIVTIDENGYYIDSDGFECDDTDIIDSDTTDLGEEIYCKDCDAECEEVEEDENGEGYTYEKNLCRQY